MRNIKINTFFVYVLLSLLFISCYERDVCNFSGLQVVAKGKTKCWFKFRMDGVITNRVYVVEYDWNSYNIGDTINCKPRDIINN